MTGRSLLLLASVAVGSGAGGWVAHGVSVTHPTPPPAGADDEVVFEFRVRSPGTAIGVPHRSGSSTVPQGALVQTLGQFDLAVEGNGYFQLTLPSGECVYTRLGAFGLSQTQTLVTAEGYQLTPNICIPQEATRVTIVADGTVFCSSTGNANHDLGVVGQITLARFPNPGWLKAEPGPGGVYRETARSGMPIVSYPGSEPCGAIRQGYREQHSGQLANALVELTRQLCQQQANEGTSGWRVQPDHPR